MFYQLTLLDNDGFETVTTASSKLTVLDDLTLYVLAHRFEVVPLGEGAYRLQCSVSKRVKAVAIIDVVNFIAV